MTKEALSFSNNIKFNIDDKLNHIMDNAKINNMSTTTTYNMPCNTTSTCTSSSDISSNTDSCDTSNTCITNTCETSCSCDNNYNIYINFNIMDHKDTIIKVLKLTIILEYSWLVIVFLKDIIIKLYIILVPLILCYIKNLTKPCVKPCNIVCKPKKFILPKRTRCIIKKSKSKPFRCCKPKHHCDFDTTIADEIFKTVNI